MPVRSFPLTCVAGAMLAVSAGAAVAQSATAPSSGNTVPQAANPSGPSQNLSETLDKSGGVIRPQTNVDPGIATAAPAPDAGTMPVIRPPGSPGGDPTVQPK